MRHFPDMRHISFLILIIVLCALIDSAVFSQSFINKKNTIADNTSSLEKEMPIDTVNLRTFCVYAWVSKHAFKESFLNFNHADTNYDNAIKNQKIIAYQAKCYSTYSSWDLQQTQEYYTNDFLMNVQYAGQVRADRLIKLKAPFQFLSALLNHDFKRETYQDYLDSN